MFIKVMLDVLFSFTKYFLMIQWVNYSIGRYMKQELNYKVAALHYVCSFLWIQN